MQRAIVGLLKGLVVGGGVGYGLLHLGWTNSVWVYAACAVVGALVGVVCGRPPWKADTIWTPIVKMIIGGIIGAGLAAIGRRLLPATPLPSIQGHELALNSGAILSLAVGVLYGTFVEIDDGGAGKEGAAADKSAPPAAPAKKK